MDKALEREWIWIRASFSALVSLKDQIYEIDYQMQDIKPEHRNELIDEAISVLDLLRVNLNSLKRFN